MAEETKVSVTLPDLQVLDCRLCSQPLTIPVFHCKNGHTACKSCLERLESKCATCELEIDSRCSVLEQILQSFKPCKNRVYGCTDLISYGNAKDHAMNCVYECYPCPESGCQFRGLSGQLTDHFLRNHYTNYTSFGYSRKFDLKLMKNPEIYVLKDWSFNDVFVVRNETATCDGINNISISFVSPTPGFSRKVVEVTVAAPLKTLKFCGRIPTARSISNESQPPAQLIIHREALELWDSFSINLKLCLWKKKINLKLSEGDVVDAYWEFEKEKRRVKYILERVRTHVDQQVWGEINTP